MYGAANQICLLAGTLFCIFPLWSCKPTWLPCWHFVHEIRGYSTQDYQPHQTRHLGCISKLMGLSLRRVSQRGLIVIMNCKHKGGQFSVSSHKCGGKVPASLSWTPQWFEQIICYMKRWIQSYDSVSSNLWKWFSFSYIVFIFFMFYTCAIPSLFLFYSTTV